MLNTPKKISLYWGRNRPLSYMRFLTVVSFCELNPDWAVDVYYPDRPILEEPWSTREQKGGARYSGWDYFQNLAELRTVSLRPSCVGEGLPEVPRSDLLRWNLLAEKEGGWWSDFDVLYIRPMAHLGGFLPAADVYLCNESGWNSIGFLGAAGTDASVSVFKSILRIAEEQVSTLSYQAAGRLAVDRVNPRERKPLAGVHNFPYRVVYPLRPNDTPRYFQREKLDLAPETIGLHWFGGHPTSLAVEERVGELSLFSLSSESFLLKQMKEFSW